MNEDKRCLLSVAMIMKNEENNLDRALGSIKPYVDEIVIVDTGSTDNSVEIAKKYTDKIFFHEWKDDFSEARNYSLQFPTCDWVLIYDADEEVREDFAGIRKFLEELPDDVNTVYLPTISYLDWDLKKTEVASTARLFRNGTVHYENIVHNQAIHKGKVVEAPFKIYHYGYIWTRDLKKKKYDRTKSLLVKLLNESKDIPTAERVYYLCQLYKTESISEFRYKKYAIVDQIMKLVEEDRKLPSIGLEIFFLHGIDLYTKGLYESAEELFKFTLSLQKDNPDPYYGLLAIAEVKKDYEKLIEYGIEFFSRIEQVEKYPEKFVWTITSIKYLASARALITIGYLKKKDIKNFKSHFKKIFPELEKTNEDAARIFKPLVAHLSETDIDTFKQLIPDIEMLLNFAVQKGITLDIIGIVSKDLEAGRMINPDVYAPFLKSRFEKLLLKRLSSSSEEDLIIEYFLGEDKIEAIKKYGVDALIFYFENSTVDDVEKLKFLNEIKKLEDDVLKGTALSFIGDIYLKMGNFKLALEYYKRSIETFPELAKFVKSVLDDLRTKLDSDIDGVFQEVKDYLMEHKEFFADISKEFDVKELRQLYLLSDSDFAKYVSAVFLSDLDKAKSRKLLESISNVDKLPFYNFRYAKLLEDSEDQDELRNSFQLHLEACKRNVKTGDMLLNVYPFDGFYPSESFGDEKDKIVWVGNISEKHSGLGVISPVRMWRNNGEFYYVYPFPKAEVLKVYKKRSKDFNLPSLIVEKNEILKVLYDVEMNDLKVLEDSEKLIKNTRSACLEVGIGYSEQSKNILSFELLNTEINIQEALSEFSKGILFYFVPDFGNREDIVWYYPLFRFIRDKKSVDILLNALKAKRVRHYVLTKNLRAVVFER
ncbi:MAG TPA: glycosyltransferase [Fervidobacterium sp.]|nr:glycosyltransferase [Fervidobacterium sp.]